MLPVLSLITHQNISDVMLTIFSTSTGLTCHRAFVIRQSFTTSLTWALVPLNW